MSEILNKEPKLVWKYFEAITQIPHGSKNEAALRDYLIGLAKEKGLEHKVDESGNLVVKVPATPGYEDRPILVLQGHLDMVCEKNSDTVFDFEKDGLNLKIEGEYLKADGTSLGADNGVGVAAGLAIIDDESAEHGPLELLMTVDEETGLTGAFAMKGDLLEGRMLLNLDTEEWGALYVGCAGGAESMLTLPLEREEMPAGHTLLRLIVSGMHGGHSGVDIHLQRANATKVLSRAVWNVARKMDIRLGCIRGGNKHNAIPREARCLVAVEEAKRAEFTELVNEQIDIIRSEFVKVDPEIKLVIEDAEPIKVFTKDTSDKVIQLLNALPHGVAYMSYDIPDLVETSSNLAIVDSQQDKMEITMSNRSSNDTAVDGVRDRIAAIAGMVGATVEEPAGYPGWKPNLDSKILEISKNVYTEMFGSEPEIKAIHAGLECGIIGEKFPGIDMASMGPQIEFPHSPDERVHIGSVEKFYNLLKGVLKKV